ncbi:hypothetical protein BH11CYA1_BH11CYA1_12930 [soil metagenome]
MAEFQLVVPYKPMQTKLQLVGVCTILPVWSLFAPMALTAFIVVLVKFPNDSNLFYNILILLTLASIMILGLLTSALSEDNKIHISKNGMSFPPFLLPKLGLKRNWQWSELRTASLIDGPSGQQLVLGFQPNLLLPLNVADLPKGHLEEFLLAIELWGTNCQRSDELVEFQRTVQGGNDQLSLGHTKMWQDELGRRFTVTTFVPLEPGKTLQNGKLKVVRQLAFGGLSAIYLVQKNETEMFVLKEAVVPPSAESEVRQMAEQHLVREAKMLFGLRHPNIARVLDHFVEDDRHYLLMEYIHGQDLRQYVKQNGACAEKPVLNWALRIAEILQFLHSQNPPVVHRDLTPDNLVLKNDGTVVLIDFGASNEFVGTATGTLVGKQAYIAPEQLRGKTVPQSDLYALGGTLHYLLTGRDPVPLCQADIRAILPDISDEMENLVMLLTAFEKEDRLASAEHLIEHLKAIEAKTNDSVPALAAAAAGETGKATPTLASEEASA